ncbi:hypothetical protein Goshw_025572 [Gossypium schwendimanii]|uniref:Uncharacterized protein n=1 Tax=Gossypium schwendimanii TaxID=34291 RepID=A0A7J9N1L7_GOSSC|nr:hypothetical protein [Gossypium schwendimanii]
MSQQLWCHHRTISKNPRRCFRQ